MGGAPVYPLNVTVYSGRASTSTSQGTARMTLILANYDGNDLSEPISVYIVGPNITTNPVLIFQCPNTNNCHVVTEIRIPSYTALRLSSTTTALYFGIQIQKGTPYRCYVNMTSEGITYETGSVAAL